MSRPPPSRTEEGPDRAKTSHTPLRRRDPEPIPIDHPPQLNRQPKRTMGFSMTGQIVYVPPTVCVPVW